MYGGLRRVRVRGALRGSLDLTSRRAPAAVLADQSDCLRDIQVATTTTAALQTAALPT